MGAAHNVGEVKAEEADNACIQMMWKYKWEKNMTVSVELVRGGLRHVMYKQIIAILKAREWNLLKGARC